MVAVYARTPGQLLQLASQSLDAQSDSLRQSLDGAEASAASSVRSGPAGADAGGAAQVALARGMAADDNDNGPWLEREEYLRALEESLDSELGPLQSSAAFAAELDSERAQTPEPLADTGHRASPVFDTPSPHGNNQGRTLADEEYAEAKQ
jgi:hypothetical protein